MVCIKKNSKQTTEAVSKENGGMVKSMVAKGLKDLELGLQQDKKNENVKPKQAYIALFVGALCVGFFVAIILVCCMGESSHSSQTLQVVLESIASVCGLDSGGAENAEPDSTAGGQKKGQKAFTCGCSDSDGNTFTCNVGGTTTVTNIYHHAGARNTYPE